MMDRDRQLTIYANALKDDLISITQARVALGTASFTERCGYRWPWLFRRWAAANEKHDRESSERRRQINESIATSEEAWRRLRDSVKKEEPQ